MKDLFLEALEKRKARQQHEDFQSQYLPDPAEQPEEEGFLSWLGDKIDRPGNALRGTLTGNTESIKGLAGWLPGGDWLTGYDKKKGKVSGQKLLRDAGILRE